MTTPTPEPCFRYAAKVNRVVDGDTLDVTVDVGFRMSITTPVRLLGVNAPERFNSAGKKSTEYTTRWLAGCGNRVIIESAKPGDYGDKYGRWLARVYRPDTGACLNDDMVALGYAVVMPT